jgi:Tol biopolymer transport system component
MKKHRSVTKRTLAVCVALIGIIFGADTRAQEFQEQISPNIRMIGKGSFPHWSGTTGLITFTERVGEQYEVFTMKPDGSEVRCLTKDKAGLRECGNRGQSYWHPSGKYIVFHAENRNLKRIGLGASARPGWGRNFNVWVMTADGEKFWRLTDYPDNWAVMETKFSHDGTKVTWNEEYSMEKYPNGKPGDKLMPWSKPDGSPNGHPGAYHTREQFECRKGEEMLCWRIVYADITFGNDGPKISNIRKINPPDNFTLNEANGFTPDDNGFIGCYSDLKANRGLARWGEIYTCDLDGKLSQRITDTVWKHNEDPCFSPDGKRIAYKETKGTPGQGDEIFISDSDGRNKKQITHFCDKGYPEYDPKAEQDADRKVWGSAGTRITEMCFSPDGKQIVFGRCQAETHKLGEAEAGNLDTLKTLTDVPSFIYVLDLPKLEQRTTQPTKHAGDGPKPAPDGTVGWRKTQ